VTPETCARLARAALEAEVSATPKPGLVDRANTGAHRDMDYDLFLRSAAALEPFFADFYRLGAETPCDRLLPALRARGLTAEEAMFRATGGVNTHKGALFSLGLLCAACGALERRGEPLTPDGVCRFDSLISHDITYVGVIQTAQGRRGSRKFPVPYVMTNCHNSLCAVGGTINEDDHIFGLSAAKKYGGIYVPANMAVIHQYAREMMAGCGLMILGSDSHTRYGALGTMGVGEGGPEIVKQLLGDTYDIAHAPGDARHISRASPPRGVGPHDVAIALCGACTKTASPKTRCWNSRARALRICPWISASAST
jgi:hypothetical protein